MFDCFLQDTLINQKGGPLFNVGERLVVPNAKEIISTSTERDTVPILISVLMRDTTVNEELMK